MGKRPPCWLLAVLVHRFKYLKVALSVVLVFIGAKIFYNQLLAFSQGASFTRCGKPVGTVAPKPLLPRSANTIEPVWSGQQIKLISSVANLRKVGE